MLNPTEIREKLLCAVSKPKETHAGLWLDKCLADQGEKDNRSKLVKEVSELSISAIYQHYFARWKKELAAYGAKFREAKAKGRMIIGLGNKSVLETGISLHQTYGVPYIPGSALKGLAASYARLYLAADCADWQEKKGKYYQTIFGNTDDAGYIIFFDALYIPNTGYQGKALYPDVITVHHQEYYQGGDAAPADRDNPNPVPFLSATGTYLIALAAPDLQQPNDWVSITFDVLQHSLGTLGIGAKTSSGYGRMEFLSPLIDPELQKAEGYKRELDAIRNPASHFQGFYQKWQQLTSQKARTILADAIIAKVRQANREKVSAEKAWYKELQACLSESNVC